MLINDAWFLVLFSVFLNLTLFIQPLDDSFYKRKHPNFVLRNPALAMQPDSPPHTIKPITSNEKHRLIMADIHAQCLHREGKLRGMIQPTTSHLKDAITVFTQPQAAR